jgi:hypothetical protein
MLYNGDSNQTNFAGVTQGLPLPVAYMPMNGPVNLG